MSSRLWLLAACLLAGAPRSGLAAGGTVSGKVTATPAKFLEETVVYLVEVPGHTAPRSLSLDQKGMLFHPHVLAVARGDTVKFLNHDAMAHNVFSSDFEGYNLGTFKPGESRTHVFSDTTGVYTQLCSIHPEMLAFIFVGQNPYSSVVDHDGSFVLKDVPPGSYKLAVWNSHLKAPLQSVSVAAGKTVQANFALHR